MAREVIVDFALVPDVIAGGEDVEPVAEQFVGQMRRNAETSGGILGVGNSEVDLLVRHDLAQMLSNDGTARSCESDGRIP